MQNIYIYKYIYKTMFKLTENQRAATFFFLPIVLENLLKCILLNCDKDTDTDTHCGDYTLT